MDSEYLDLLETQDWGRIRLELLSYARSKAVSGKIWLGARRSYAEKKEPMLAGGLTPQDIVHEAISQVLEGKGDAKWDPARCADIRPLLRSRVRGKVSDLLRLAENRKGVSIPKDADGAERVDWLEAGKGTNKSLAEDAHGDHSQVEFATAVLEGLSATWHAEHSESDSWIASLKERLRDAPRLSEVLDYVLNGTPVRGMVDPMGLPKREINNLMKRLRRRLGGVLQSETPTQRKANA